MRTTLVIDDHVFLRLKAEASRSRTTLSALVETALRNFLRGATSVPARRPKLPAFDCGGPLADIDDRGALLDELLSPVEELRKSYRVADSPSPRSSKPRRPRVRR